MWVFPFPANALLDGAPTLPLLVLSSAVTKDMSIYKTCFFLLPTCVKVFYGQVLVISKTVFKLHRFYVKYFRSCFNVGLSVIICLILFSCAVHFRKKTRMMCSFSVCQNTLNEVQRGLQPYIRNGINHSKTEKEYNAHFVQMSILFAPLVHGK